ncbi:Exo-poly-alpha-D-galacturonosidase [Camellia lanceoleosa]|uniref:Exo-poly-alpha-D-galacturonosidase n=1 Tax=Camellia lanceoleosa TaxID=1840588 RepID=A0ACC0FU13_9ERIC|nr:Exo-poly-alpha-D-galacturonosidase [Camellia lanceoleosa]
MMRSQLLGALFIFFSSLFETPTPTPTPTPAATQLPQSVSVRDYGAVGDGVHYDTLHIQAAIDACSSAPGVCRVFFPPGTYLTSTLFLKSGVVLDLHRGAKILGGTKLEDYPAESSTRWYVVLAEDADDVGITGGGEINGQGLKFVERFDERKNVMVSWNRTGACFGDECRPRLVGFLRCRNVRVSNISLIEPAYWCLHLVQCENSFIHDVSIYGDFNTPNNDGIDIEDSNNTVITRTKSSGIKLGSASWFAFKGLVFDNITIVDSHRGLGLQIRDGGNVSDITFSNINISTRYYDPSWWGRAEPIYVTTCPRHRNSKAGSISNVQFVNITAKSENGVVLLGSRRGLLRNLKFLNVNITYKRWTTYDGGLVDYRPGCEGLVKHRMAGIIMEHIEGLEVENLNMRWSKDRSAQWNNPLDFRPSTVNDISLLNFHSGLYRE